MPNSTLTTSTPTPLALRPRDAAKALGISARTLWGLTAPRGPIPCLRIGHGKRQTVLYPVAMLEQWLAEQAEAEKGGEDDAENPLGPDQPPWPHLLSSHWPRQAADRAVPRGRPASLAEPTIEGGQQR